MKIPADYTFVLHDPVTGIYEIGKQRLSREQFLKVQALTPDVYYFVWEESRSYDGPGEKTIDDDVDG